MEKNPITICSFLVSLPAKSGPSSCRGLASVQFLLISLSALHYVPTVQSMLLCVFSGASVFLQSVGSYGQLAMIASSLTQSPLLIKSSPRQFTLVILFWAGASSSKKAIKLKNIIRTSGLADIIESSEDNSDIP
ncbi:uncharacterized protein LOC109843248 [Asparagus officinalis]|uniref:uncharacterized protein LOC109843248 n=1 Tax=Asparagus officinalis TaxID=4686 RepID=UPI00098E1249|nr:uncharacterized protein LOC109843248 [Asparagus officinalis]